MKNLPLLVRSLLFGILFFLSQTSFAQKNNIKVGINGAAAFGKGYEQAIDFGYERSIDLHRSFLVNIQRVKYDYFEIHRKPEGGNFRLNLGHRKYKNPKKAMNGRYFGQHLSISSTGDYEKHDPKSNFYLASFGLDWGYQKRWKSFNFDIGTALDYNFFIRDGNTFKNISKAQGRFIALAFIGRVQPSIYASIGYAF